MLHNSINLTKIGKIKNTNNYLHGQIINETSQKTKVHQGVSQGLISEPIYFRFIFGQNCFSVATNSKWLELVLVNLVTITDSAHKTIIMTSLAECVYKPGYGLSTSYHGDIAVLKESHLCSTEKCAIKLNIPRYATKLALQYTLLLQLTQKTNT